MAVQRNRKPMRRLNKVESKVQEQVQHDNGVPPEEDISNIALANPEAVPSLPLSAITQTINGLRMGLRETKEQLEQYEAMVEDLKLRKSRTEGAIIILQDMIKSPEEKT